MILSNIASANIDKYVGCITAWQIETIAACRKNTSLFIYLTIDSIGSISFLYGYGWQA